MSKENVKNQEVNEVQEAAVKVQETVENQVSTEVIERVDQEAVTYTGMSVVQFDDPAQLMEAFKNGSALFLSTIENDGNRATQAKIYNALSNAETLRDHTNKVLSVTDYMAHPVTFLDEPTGEIVTDIRIVLVTADGQAYGCVSKGIQSALQRLSTIVGQPTWNPPLDMKIIEKKGKGTNRFMTVELV